MNGNLLKTITMVAMVMLVFSCRHDGGDPMAGSKCPLLSVSGAKGNVREYEWVANKLIRVYSKDSIPTTLVFKYNSRNLPEKMEIQTENSTAKYIVAFLYDDKNRVSRTRTSLSGVEFMQNDFLYNTSNNIASINTSVELFGKKVTGKTRIEYAGDNVSKVYSSIDNDQESIAFWGEKYDDKKQFCPDVYTYAAMGFVGIANNFFSFFGKNNMIEGRIYDGKGRIDQKTTVNYLYNKDGLPTRSETILERNSKITTEINNYIFACQ